MKRRKVLSLLMTAVLTFSSVAPQSSLVAFAEGEEDSTDAVVEDGALPYGLAGMPEGYQLSNVQLEMKQAMKEHDVLTQLADTTEGEDYAKGEVIALAGSEEEAQQIAAAYNGTLTYYAQGVAEIALPEDLTVAEAVEASINYDLPVVEANYRTVLEDPAEDRIGDISNATSHSLASDSRKDGDSGWTRWVGGSTTEEPLLDNADIYLMDPDSNFYQWMHDAIGTWDAWSATMGDPSIRVAVIDTGVQPDHPDLKGYVEQIKVGDIDPDTYYSPHGTHVAGIIGARANNGIGVAGVAPRVSIVSLNIFIWDDEDQDCYCETDDEIRALNICMDEKIPIANMSIGGPYYSAMEDKVMTQAHDAGVSVFVAMGNENANAKSYPAGYTGAIAVASTNIKGERSFFSNFGDWCAIAAPGTDIMSTYNNRTDNSEDEDVMDGPDYGLMSGTSMATPVVAGVAALYMSKMGVVKPDEMKAVMQDTASKSSSKGIGAGIVNVAAMFENTEVLPVLSLSEDGRRVLIETDNVDNGAAIIYTIGDKKPAVKAGQVVYGERSNGSYDLSEYPSDTNVTVNALAISSQGKVSRVVSETFTTPKAKTGTAEIESVELEEKELSLGASDNDNVRTELYNADLTVSVIAGGKEIALDSVEYRLVSSNPEVATAYLLGNGKIRVNADKAGTAVISVEVYGTSVKSASVKVNVEQLAEYIEIKGQEAIVAGGNASYKGKVYPAKIKDSKISWSVEANEKVSVDGKGKVTVASDATGEFLLIASTESGASSEKCVQIAATKATGVSISSEDERLKDGKSATIFSANVPHIEGVDNEIRLKASSPYVTWKSSNPKVASVDRALGDTATIRGLKAGTARITCVTADGSNKKASITIKVIVPVSELVLNSDQNSGENYAGRIGVGKSVQLNYTLGSTYGKPTITALNYMYTLIDPGTGTDLTEKARKLGVVKISKKGKISIDRKKWAGVFDGEAGHSAYLSVAAMTTDGTELVNTALFVVQPAASYFVAKEVDQYGLRPVKNIIYDGSWINDGDSEEDMDFYPIFIETDAYLKNDVDVDVTCSNTDLVGVYPIGLVTDDHGNAIRDPQTGHYFYRIELLPADNQPRKGTATITVTAKDGSKKKAKFKITIK